MGPNCPALRITQPWRDAISYFQTDTDGLEVTGELDGPTCNKLRDLHDCEPGDGDAESEV